MSNYAGKVKTINVPVRHESEYGKILDLQKEQTYLITRETSGAALETINYGTPLPEFMFNSYFSTAEATDYDVQTGKSMETALDMCGMDTVTSLQVPSEDPEQPDFGYHKPVLDIDFPAALIPSSTEGHFHLYLDKELTWDNYVELLKVLAKCGIIEQGYANASIDRTHTSARLPWVKKPGTGIPKPPANPFVEPVKAPTIAERGAGERLSIRKSDASDYPNPTYL